MFAEYTICVAILLVSILGVYLVLSKRRFDAVGGLVLGFAFFVGGPCLQLLLFGRIEDYSLGVPGVRIEESTHLIGYMFLGALFSLLFLFVPFRKRSKSIGKMFDELPNVAVYFWLFILSYLILAITIFLISGKQNGAHWMESNRDMYVQGALPSIIGNFYNVLRVAFSGVILFSCVNGLITWKKALALLFVFCVFDLFVSSNRVIILFALIAACTILAKVNKRYLLLAALILPVIIQFNQMFPSIRGVMWKDGLSAAQISESFRDAAERKSTQEILPEEILGSAFESSNIMVAQYAMNTFGKSTPYLYGETMLLKPITFFLPRSVVSFKPEGFSARMGSEIAGNDVLSLNSTLLGEAFANFGWFGPLVFFCTSVLFVWMSKFVGGALFNAQFFFVFFASWRFDYSFMLISVFVLSVFVIFCRIFNRLSSRRLSFARRSKGALPRGAAR